MIEIFYLVYKHTNKINGKAYIGITCRPPKIRWGNGSNYKQSPVFYKAIQKYGWNNFSHEILETGLTKEEAREKEKFYINYFNTYIFNNGANGYNMTLGGEIPSNLNKIAIIKDNKRKYIVPENLQKYLDDGWSLPVKKKNTKEYNKEAYAKRKAKNYFIDYTKKNKESLKEYKHNYYVKNKQKLNDRKDYMKEYRQKNAEHLKQYKKEYAKKNAEYTKQYKHAYYEAHKNK